MSTIEMPKAGNACTACSHDSGEHTRIVGLIPRWSMYTYGCSRCSCQALTHPPDAAPSDPAASPRSPEKG